MNPKDYPVEIRPLAAADDDDDDGGGGWLATFPDLPGCMGDGDTPEAAAADGYEAAQAWLSVAAECGDPIPKPGMGGESGRFVARVPQSLHTRLVAPCPHKLHFITNFRSSRYGGVFAGNRKPTPPYQARKSQKVLRYAPHGAVPQRRLSGLEV